MVFRPEDEVLLVITKNYFIAGLCHYLLAYINGILHSEIHLKVAKVINKQSQVKIFLDLEKLTLHIESDEYFPSQMSLYFFH